MSIREQEKKPSSILKIDVENKIFVYPDFSSLSVGFDLEIFREVTARMAGKKAIEILSPSDSYCAGVKPEDELTSVSVSPNSTIIHLIIAPGEVDFLAESICFEDSAGTQHQTTVDLRTNSGQSKEIGNWLETLTVVLEENLSGEKTPKAEAMVKGLRRLINLLREKDWQGDYLYEFVLPQRKAPISPSDLGG